MAAREFCSEDEDDWFYDSIKRYKQLFMFDFENAPKQLQLSDAKSICVTSTDRSGHSDILELSLPKKLTVSPEQEGLVKSCDFKMKSGGFTKSPLVQMKVLYGRKKVLTSEKDETGVAVYQLGSEETGIISRIGCFPCELLAPRLSCNNSHLLVMTTTDKQGLVLMDIEEGIVMETIKWDEGDSHGHCIKPEFVSSNVVSLCSIQNGAVKIFDVRSKHSVCNILPGHMEMAEEGWTVSSSYLSSPCTDDTTDLTKLALISSMGTVSIYDLRNVQDPLCKGNIERDMKETAVVSVKFCPTNSSVISISGFNENVYMCDTVSAELKTIFIHDGHAKQHISSKSNNITCHLWYEDMIISAAENKSVHCWQFIDT